MNEQNAAPTPSVKKTYSKPTLTEYGHVSALTQAGSRTTTEPGGTPSTDPAKRISDPAAKTNARRIGTHPWGIGLYLFEYLPQYQAKFGTGRHFGCMADEVEAVCPEAVERDEQGIRCVDYAKLGIRFPVH